MAATFNDDAERNFFVEHPFTKYNCLLYLQLLGETKRVNRIAPFLDEMRVQGMDVDQHLYCAAISACGDQVEAAMNLERDMIEGTFNCASLSASCMCFLCFSQNLCSYSS